MDNMEEKKENLIQVDLREIMETSFLDYSMSVIVQRALPDVRDGLKPVHRRILYTMYENALWPEKAYRKCADTVGSVLGRYHPHGDASVYDALVRLAQDFSMRYMLIDGHGNFGSVDGDPPAAYRYTEARMSKLSVEMLKDIEKDTVDFSPNYDDRLKEPNVLPSHFPNILVNGSTGIAVGMATNIPPHNMGEVLDGVCAMVDNPDIDLDGLMQYIKGPDFPTGGIIMGRSGIRAAYGTGRGRIYVRARAEIVEKPNGRYQIVVTELPYQVNKARLIENIAELVKDKRIDGISNIDDHSDRNGMHIAIDIKREASPQLVLNHLYSLTQMQITFGVIMLAIVDGQPKLLTLRDILQEYIKFQSEVVLRRTQFDLKKAQERAHILEGLMIALDFIDEVIAILRNSKSIPEGKVALMERFGLDDVQAQAIVQMRLGQLTGLERTKLEEELAALRLKIADFLDIIASEARRYGIIKDEAMEKFASGVTGRENVGKYMHTTRFWDADANDFQGWTITPIDKKIRDYIESQIKIANKADAAATSGFGLDPVLSNLIMDNKLSSGSEKLYSIKVYNASETAIPDMILCKPLMHYIRANYPGSRTQVGLYRSVVESEQSVTPANRMKENI